MNNNIKLSGFIAIIAVLSMVMSGCPQEEKKAGVSSLSAPSPSSAVAFPGDINDVADRDAAWDLFEKVAYTTNYNGNVNGANNYLWSSQSISFGDAFKKAYNAVYSLDKVSISDTGRSISLSIPDTPIQEISGLKIRKGSSSSSVSLTGGMTYSQYLSGTGFFNDYSNWDQGWGYTTKNSASATFDFSEFLAISSAKVGSTNTSKYQAAGIIQVSGKYESGMTVKDKLNEIYTDKDVTETKYSFVLTVIDNEVNVGAIYRFSYASNDSSDDRKVSSKRFSEISNLEVYGSDKKLKYEFNDIDGSPHPFGLSGLASNVSSQGGF